MKTDSYAILEVQGHIYGVPTYDRKTKILWFTVTPKNGVLLPIFARGEIAKAFKTLLHAGVFVQGKAIPFQEIITFNNGMKKINTAWEAKKLLVLSTKKIKLGQYEDLGILDGLMPEDDEVGDVGYIEPESWERFIAKREALKKKGGETE